MSLLDRAETKRRETLSKLDATEQSEKGQFFTPHEAAKIIAALPKITNPNHLKILDPGAGSGILTAAIVQRIRTESPSTTIDLTAVEMDPILHNDLTDTLNDIKSLGNIKTTLVKQDFITWALATDQRFDLVIQNPPYKKLSTSSETQTILRTNGIVVPNIYAAFLTLGLKLLTDKGQQVSITPRSWMNGTYYSAFRRDFLNKAGIDAIHTFESRSKVFGDTGVLQEAIIVSATRGETPTKVQIHTSHDHREATSTRQVPYADVVTEDFIHVPATEHDAAAVKWMQRVPSSLQELGLTVSTGRLVDFRSRDLLFFNKEATSLPLISPSNVKSGKVVHPIEGGKKPQWFNASPEVAAKVLLPAGTYVVIKRFSSKEENRRIVAAVWSSTGEVVFDNKLNYIHHNGQGLEPATARGLANYLNSTQVDDYFRVFSGHTQVNATDLRQMAFPTLKQLHTLSTVESVSQHEINTAVDAIFNKGEIAA